ncbi:MAG: TIGR02444 family protein [Sneathiellales bacterium]|nr:TIGR02444 family protein [Sneathiellales bacterium]
MAVFSSAGFPPCALWEYSVKLYSNEEVSKACLSLQDRQSLDVNIVLFCVWVAASGHGEFEGSELSSALHISKNWQDGSVKPLRDVRRFLKSSFEPIDARMAADLKRVISESELFAEKLEILALDRLIDRPATGSFDQKACLEAAALNLMTYFQNCLGKDPDMKDQSDLEAVLSGAFPEEEIVGLLLTKSLSNQTSD